MKINHNELLGAAEQNPQADMHAAADLSSQASHLGVTIQADLIKQKMPERNGGGELLHGPRWTD